MIIIPQGLQHHTVRAQCCTDPFKHRLSDLRLLSVAVVGRESETSIPRPCSYGYHENTVHGT